MAIDAYSPCPCGTGKKIKFCCPDLLGDLQKIDRMIESQQYLNCLQHIDQLQQQHPDRACLMAIKGTLLRAAGRMEDAASNAAAFVERHPDSLSALAESAIVDAVVQRKPVDALGRLQRAMATSDGTITPQVYEAMGVVAVALLNQGEVPAAGALLELQTAIAPDAPGPVEMLVELNRSPNIPLLMKEDPPSAPVPDDAPWKSKLEEALAPTATGNWQSAAERLALLAEELPDVPAVWGNLALIRGWLADTPGYIEALRKYAGLDVPAEDAAEASALAMMASDDPLGDRFDVLRLEWQVHNVEELQAELTLAAEALQLPFEPPAAEQGDEPPPKAAYLLIDRPVPKTANGVKLDDVPRFLGQIMLYGRQTDREARLEVLGVTASNLEQTQALLARMTADKLGPDFKQQLDDRLSASQDLLLSKMRPPDDISPEQLDELVAEHRRDALLNRWPELKLGILDGKTPRQAAEQGGYRVELSAAVIVLESWSERARGGFDFNELRKKLGLSVLEPIDPKQNPVNAVPLVRLGRVMVEELSDEDLLWGYRRAAAFGAGGAVQKFARAVIQRPALSGREEQLRAYRDLAHAEEDSDKALDYLNRGRAAAESSGRSPASWLLLELSYRFARREGHEIQRLIDQIQSRHIEEPGVAEALTRFLVRIGALHPDGTPVAAPPGEPIAAGTEAAAGEVGKIWTPGSDQSGSGGKLWTPD